MAFYDKFPYTNFQELNLDWITQEISKVRDNRDASDASAAAALASEQAAKASETAAAASQQAAAKSETAAAGSEAASADYLAQIGTHTAGAVADWMKENLQPTTPPVDESLTVSGAAADAKVTGNKLSDLNQAFNTSAKRANLFNGNTHSGIHSQTDGDSYGTATPNADYFYTDLIDIEGITSFYAFTDFASSAYVYLTFFDSDTKVIGQYNGYNLFVKQASIPANSKYVIACTRNIFQDTLIISESIPDRLIPANSIKSKAINSYIP